MLHAPLQLNRRQHWAADANAPALSEASLTALMLRIRNLCRCVMATDARIKPEFWGRASQNETPQSCEARARPL